MNQPLLVRDDLPCPRFELLYTCPVDGEAYGDRIEGCAASQASPIAVHRFERPEALARWLRFAAFVSPSLPTVVVMRDGEIIAEMIGTFTFHALRRMVERAVGA